MEILQRGLKAQSDFDFCSLYYTVGAMSACSNFEVSECKLGGIIILSILYSITLTSCKEYRAEDKRIERYLGDSIYSVSEVMKNAKETYSSNVSQKARNDSVFDYEYVPEKIEIEGQEYDPHKFIRYINISFRSLDSEIVGITKTYHMKNEESLKNKFTGTVLSMTDKYGVTKCKYGLFVDKKPDIMGVDFISDWGKLGSCESASWNSGGTKMYSGEYKVRIKMVHNSARDVDADDTEKYIYSVTARKDGLYD